MVDNLEFTKFNYLSNMLNHEKMTHSHFIIDGVDVISNYLQLTNADEPAGSLNQIN